MGTFSGAWRKEDSRLFPNVPHTAANGDADLNFIVGAAKMTRSGLGGLLGFYYGYPLMKVGQGAHDFEGVAVNRC